MILAFFYKWKKKSPLSDEELIERYKFSHDKQYITELYGRYSTYIAAICIKYLKNRMEAEDAAMDVYEVLVRDLKSHKVEKFKSWLAVVCRNHCLKQLKELRKINHLPIEEKSDKQTITNTPDLDTSLIETKENRLIALEEALEQLNQHQKTCVRLFYLEKKTYKSISLETGYTLKQVKSYIQNGKRNLKIDLQNLFNES